MSAILVLKMIPDDEIQHLLSLPVEDRLDQYFPEDFVAREQRTDTDVAWHAIHFLLTGTLQSGIPPASFLLAGGTILGPSALAASTDIASHGLGEIDRVLSSAEVSEVDDHLAIVTDQQLRKTYKDAAHLLADVYPGIWHNDSEQDISDLLLSYHAMRKFVKRARENGFGLLLHFA